MKFSPYATTLLLLSLSGLSLSHTQRMGTRSRSLEEDEDETDQSTSNLEAVVDTILEPIYTIPVVGDIIEDVIDFIFGNEEDEDEELTYDEIVKQVITDFGYPDIPDPYCNQTEISTLTVKCNGDGELVRFGKQDVSEINDYNVIIGDTEEAQIGFLSSYIGHFTTLTSLFVSSNTNTPRILSGTIPSEIGLLTELGALIISDPSDLDLGGGGLTGSVPSELSNLDELYMLLLIGNTELTGSIPGGMDSLETLQIYGTNISDFDDAYCDIDPTIVSMAYPQTNVPEDTCA